MILLWEFLGDFTMARALIVSQALTTASTTSGSDFAMTRDSRFARLANMSEFIDSLPSSTPVHLTIVRPSRGPGKHASLVFAQSVIRLRRFQRLPLPCPASK